jgi:hypothetical protein
MANRAALIRAENPGLPVVGRGRHHIEFDLGGGKKQRVLTIERLHLADETTEIDTGIVADTGAWQWKLVATDYQAHFRSVFNVGNIYEWRKGDQWIIVDPQSINWINQDNSRQQIAIKQAVTGVVSDDTLTFTNAYGTGRHFSYAAHPNKLIKHLTIDSAANLPAPTVTGTIHFEAEWTISTSTGVDLWLDGVKWAKTNGVRVKTANRIEFRNTANTEVLWYADAPLATDANGRKAQCEYEVRRQGGPSSLFITVRVPKTWIDAAAFPIVIDPTFTDGYGGDATTYKDTDISLSSPTTNYGSDTTFYTGNYDSGTSTDRTLIQFAVSSIPGDPVLDTVTFSIYVTADYCGYARTVRVYRLKRDWVESQATWNIYSTGNSWQTAGAAGADDRESTDIGSRAFSESESSGYKDFTLTPTSKSALDLGYGWIVKTDTESLDMYEYASSDNATTSRRPKLVVVYTAGGGGRTTKNTDSHPLGIHAGISRRVNIP